VDCNAAAVVWHGIVPVLRFAFNAKRPVQHASNNRPSARDQLQEKHDERNYKQNVDESTQRVGTDDSQQPQNQKDYKDCPKHALTSRGYVLYSAPVSIQQVL
jgi:hypothetical protein